MVAFIQNIWRNRLVWAYFPANYFQILRRDVNYLTYPIISGKVLIVGSGKIRLGKNVRINSCTRSNPIGGDTQVILSTDKRAKLVIGDNTGISNCALISKNSISIGKNVNIGGGVKIYDSDFHNLNSDSRKNPETDIPKSAPIIIGNNCFIGAHSIILKGVNIGDNSIVGAGSIVSKSIPSNEIWAGNPAKFIKKIN